MKAVANFVILILAFAMIPALGQAQTDRFGIADTIYADLAKVDDQHWTITIGFTNDEDIEGIEYIVCAGPNSNILSNSVHKPNWSIFLLCQLLKNGLSKYDIIILQPSIIPYSPFEIESLKDYYNSGGIILE